MNRYRFALDAAVTEADLAPKVEAPRIPWYGLPHCESCQIARNHEASCLCGHCATAGQHVADAIAERSIRERYL